LAYGYYLQFATGLEPCPLCIFQRLAYFIVGGLAAIAAAHGARYQGAFVYCNLLVITSLAGAGLAGRQVWLQHLPADQVPECGPSLEFLMEMYPLFETIQTVLRGSGDCAKVDWTLLGFSIAEWSLFCFLGFALLAAGTLYQRALHHSRGARRRRTARAST
jgi:disulfide bond formation protein DsbB